MNLALPDLRIASAVSLNSWLVTMIDRFVDGAPVAQAVDEEEVNVVGPQRRQPLIDHFEHFFGRARHVLGDDDDFFADLRDPARTTFLKLGSVPYNLAVSKIRMPLAYAIRRTRSSLLTAPASSIEISRPVLPSLRVGSTAVFATSSCAGQSGRQTHGRGRRQRPAWRNLRRSVRSVSSCAIAFDSS